MKNTADKGTLKPYTIMTNGVDMTLELLAQKLGNGDIEVPEFQRKKVWTQVQASRLIESFMLGLPIPQIFLYEDPFTQKLLVVDGQQRLTTIADFLKGTFRNDRIFRLKGLETEWNGRTFEDFSDADKRKFKNLSLRATIFKQVDPQDDTSIFEVFERLNTGGTALNGQEVRNAVIGGDMNRWAIEQNMLPDWRRLYGKSQAHERMLDVELILRLVAISKTHGEYRKPMNSFINSYLLDNKTMSESQELELTNLFRVTIRTIIEKIGEHAFKLEKSQTINTALADALFTGIAHNIHALPTDIKARYNTLVSSQEFLDSIEQHTTDNTNVQTRINLAVQAFAK